MFEGLGITGAFLQSLWPSLLGLIAIFALKVMLKNKTGKKSKKGRGLKDDTESLSSVLLEKGKAYVGNEFLMTPTERDFYRFLESKYGDKYYIFAQVRVADVIKPNVNRYFSKTREYQALFRQISQWHFDYLLCQKEDFRIHCAIELDDPSHKRADRQRRDRILNAVCRDGGVVLKRMRLSHENKKVEVFNGK
ncbi:DUF2726 domain-containing protein [Halomonas sp. NYA30]|tara:strand:+ start:4770 stop:5348 length:579 start_codon:yes stop_codon:yes gene_type:complete